MHPPRVLMLVENNSYPQDDRVRREAVSLVTAGYDVTVVAPSSGSQRRHEVVEGVRTYRYPPPPAGDGFLGYVIEYAYSMTAALLVSLYVFVRRGFDVVHTHNPPDIYCLIGLLYRALGCRFVFDHHDLSPDLYMARFAGDGNRLVYVVLSLLQRLALRSADRVIATNDSYAAVAIEDAGVPPSRVAIVRNGPDLHRVRLVDADPELRGKASTIIGYVGEMSTQDGIDVLLRALAELRVLRSDFYCVLVGDGDALDELQELTDHLQLREHVVFTGHRTGDELMRLLSTADICVDPDPSNPYNDRSTMIKMTEYMALGKPIVAFDLREHRATADGAAVYARPNSEQNFAARLSELMDDPARRHSMGQIGRHRIERSLAWHHQEIALLELYRDLFAGHRVDRST